MLKMNQELNSPIPLAGFLFGNIDETGQLDTDLFDNDTKKYLGSLTRLGLGSFVEEIIGDEQVVADSASLRKSSVSGSDSEEEVESQNKSLAEDENSSNYNFFFKIKTILYHFYFIDDICFLRL